MLGFLVLVTPWLASRFASAIDRASRIGIWIGSRNQLGVLLFRVE